MLDSHSAQNPTSRLVTPEVGGERQRPGDASSPLPVPVPQGTRRDFVSPGCGPKSDRAEGPSSSSSSFLDSYKNNRNSFCGSWSVIGRIDEGGRKYAQVVRLGCKRWSCPVCGPKRARQLRHAIINAAQRNELRRFLTLTLDPRSCEASESVVYVRKCWNKLRTYLKRKYDESITFITVLELQKSGYAHLHILVDRYIPQQWIQSSWQKIGGGLFVNIKFVDIHRIAAYLSKYLTKELLLNQFKPGTRRFTTSRNIKLLEKAVKGAWSLIRRSIENIKPEVAREKVTEFFDQNGLLQWFRFEIAQ